MFIRVNNVTAKSATSICLPLFRDALVKNVKRAKRALERESKESCAYDFLPLTYLLPQEYSMFAEEFRKDPGKYPHSMLLSRQPLHRTAIHL